MPNLVSLKRDDAVVIRSDYWQVEHRRSAGGCWTGIRFNSGLRRNLLTAPVSSRIKLNRILRLVDPESPVFPVYCECFERRARMDVRRTPEGLIVVAEGMYRDEAGRGIGVRFRHRYEYRDWGLVLSELEIVPEHDLGGAIEVTCVELRLRPGLTHAYVRQHPASNPNVDLRGGYQWTALEPGATAFRGRYVPIHIVCFEKGVEGIELFPTSDLAEWDTGLSKDAGLGYYGVSTGGDSGTTVTLSPYCVAFRRVPITLKGPSRFRWYWGLPFIKDRRRIRMGHFNAGVGSRWPADADLERLAAAGIELLRFHNDYREDGPFWHDGMYPPYDAEGMSHLRHIIDTSHRLGMKIVPYVSLKEFHPESPGYAEHADEWAQVPAPTLREVHTWIGSGEYGRVMCLESGWLDRRKQDVDTILSDLPWDGLYFDWAKSLPCRHAGHLRGDYHCDTDGYLDFLFFSRRRVGPQGLLFVHLSGYPCMVAENLSDLVRLNDDLGRFVPEPGALPLDCDFVPITPRQMRQLHPGLRAGSVDARRLLMAGLLQGCPPSAYTPFGAADFCREALAEMGLFAGEDLSGFRLARATDRAVDTGCANVHGAIWYRRGRAMVYLGNFSGRRVRGAFRFDPALGGWKTDRAVIACRLLGPGAKPGELKLRPGVLRTRGVPYSIGPWRSLMVYLGR
jgi:hypothetical protein